MKRRLFKIINILLSILLVVGPATESLAQSALQPNLSLVGLSPAYAPARIVGLKLNVNNPLEMNFLMDRGEEPLSSDAQKQEYTKLIKYFLASLTIPDDHLWVNLSPYEKNRIIEDDLGQTQMGMDLLAQDYLLKQITASLIYPDGDLGKEFWGKVYAQIKARYGDVDIPVDTLNKVWIIPDKATVYQENNTAWVLYIHLKVMLEEDYLALRSHSALTSSQTSQNLRSDVVSIIKQMVIPKLEEEVNQGKNFSQLRQVVSSMVLATWYKRTLKETLLGKSYVDQQKLSGVAAEEKDSKLKIYNQYLNAFKTGAFNYIKEDYDPVKQEITTRKFFSGGVGYDPSKVETIDRAQIASVEKVTERLDALRQRGIDDVRSLFKTTKSIDKAIMSSQQQALINISQLKLDDVNLHVYGRNPQELIRYAVQRAKIQDAKPYTTATIEEILQKMADGEPIIDPNMDYPTVSSLWGFITINKLNNSKTYEGFDGLVQIARDLEVAHYLGFINITDMPSGGVALHTMKRLGKNILKRNETWPTGFSWMDILILRNTLMIKLLLDQKTVDQYSGTQGQIALLKHYQELGLLKKLDFRAFFESLEQSWIKTLKWKKIKYRSFNEVEEIRNAVKKLLSLSKAEREKYKGIEGQILFVSELIDQGIAKSKYLTAFFSILEKSWAKEMDWKGIGLSLDEAVRIRGSVKDLISKGPEVRSEYEGRNGMIKFLKVLHKKGVMKVTNIRQISTVLDNEWLEMMQWTNVRANLKDTEMYRALVKELIERRPENRKIYEGISGQIKFVEELKGKEMIHNTNLGTLFTTLDKEWVRIMGWSLVQLSLEDAKRYRMEVENLMNNPDKQKYYQNEGQLLFTKELLEQGKITTTHPGNLFSALDKLWTKNLQWTNLEMPLSEALKFIARVKELIESDLGQRAKYQGVGGQIKFVEELIQKNVLRSSNLGSIFVCLNNNQLQVMGWKRTISLSLEQAQKFRDAVQKIIEGNLDIKMKYQGVKGEIEFFDEIVVKEGLSALTILGHYIESLDKDWIEEMQWEYINLSFKEIKKIKSSVEVGDFESALKIGFRVFVRNDREIGDLFKGSFFIPDRLAHKTGKVIGYKTDNKGQLVLSMPNFQGVSVFDFSQLKGLDMREQRVDLNLENGVVKSFELSNGKKKPAHVIPIADVIVLERTYQDVVNEAIQEYGLEKSPFDRLASSDTHRTVETKNMAERLKGILHDGGYANQRIDNLLGLIVELHNADRHKRPITISVLDDAAIDFGFGSGAEVRKLFAYLASDKVKAQGADVTSLFTEPFWDEDIEEQTADEAVLGEAGGQTTKTPGGIDLNPSNIDLQVKQNDPNHPPMPLKFPDAPSSMNIQGLTPVILNITPVQLPASLIGLTQKEEKLSLR